MFDESPIKQISGIPFPINLFDRETQPYFLFLPFKLLLIALCVYSTIPKKAFRIDHPVADNFTLLALIPYTHNPHTHNTHICIIRFTHMVLMLQNTRYTFFCTRRIIYNLCLCRINWVDFSTTLRALCDCKSKMLCLRLHWKTTRSARCTLCTIFMLFVLLFGIYGNNRGL